MKSILNHIKELEDHEYKYYNTNLISTDIMNSIDKDEHKHFIFQYFSDGGKYKIVDDFFNYEDGFDRAIHTNSIFFLGCLLYKNLELSNKIDFFIRDHDQFYFIWFLTSLAHDFAYKYENNFVEHKSTIRNEIFNLSYNLFHPQEKCNRPYSVELQNFIQEYFEYRFNKCKIDHGIVAGMKLYDALVKNRIEQERKYGTEDKVRNLYWGDDLDPLYHCTGVAVSTHNIWIHDEMAEDIKKLYPISIDEFPLLFLLGLVDTLDPVKTFCNFDSVYVLDNIVIEFKNKNTIEIKNADNSKLDFEKLKNKVEKLDEWLSIYKPILEKNSITIIIKEIQ